MNTRFHIWVLLLASAMAACAVPPTEGPEMPTALAQLQPTRTNTPFDLTEEVATSIPHLLPQKRDDPVFYQVQDGDTLSLISAGFGLQPETVLWANYNELFDNSDALLPGMSLLILPVDGVYHQVGGGDTVTNIANFFSTNPQALIDWPGNNLNAQDPVIFTGQWLVVPGGQRFSRRRAMPNLPREAASLDPDEFGSGVCDSEYPSGPVGDGQFLWPVSHRIVKGETYTDWHSAVDIAVDIGEAVKAADDGVVVFSGWSNLGYGYMILIDHGNGDASLYGGLQNVVAVCGQSVAEGELIGEAGLTGYPAGPILHFEIRRGADLLNPLDLIPE